MQNSKIDTLPRYRERLTPSLPVFVALALLAPMVSLSFVPLDSTLALIIGLTVTAVVMALSAAMSPKIEVAGSELRVGRARIDVKWLGELQILREDAARHARGPGLSPRSWHLIRGGIDEILVAEVVDPADSMKSWVISTRTPERLAAAINQARG